MSSAQRAARTDGWRYRIEIGNRCRLLDLRHQPCPLTDELPHPRSTSSIRLLPGMTAPSDNRMMSVGSSAPRFGSRQEMITSRIASAQARTPPRRRSLTACGCGIACEGAVAKALVPAATRYLKLGFDRHLSRHLVFREGPVQHPQPRHRQPPEAADGRCVTGEVVATEEQVKGYAVGKDQYVTVEDDELAEIAIESSHTVDIEKFVPKVSIDDRYRDTPYYLAPEDKVGQEAFAVIRDAMKKKKMVGIARVVMARRERVMMLEAFGKGIMGTTLPPRYIVCEEDNHPNNAPARQTAARDLGWPHARSGIWL